LAAPVDQMVVEFHRVPALFVGLDAHPTAEAGQVAGLKVSRHREIEVRGIPFLVDLLVDGILHRLANHVSLL
jgi:hypothetical protein